MSDRYAMYSLDPKLSVIIPVYNVEKFLRRCIDSILVQDYESLEIICVDDGSTDGSGSILDEYTRKDARVKVLHKVNGGLVSARKAGLTVASGKYATCVDSDDWVEPQMYRCMMEKMVAYPVDLVASGTIRDYGSHLVYDPEKTSGLYTNEQLKQKIQDRLVDYDKPFRFLISQGLWNKIFKTDLLKKYYLGIPDDIPMAEDTVCTYPYLMHISGIYVMKECYYHYCQRATSCLMSTDMSEAVQYERVKRAFAYATNLLPPNMVNYLEQYILLHCCPNYAMRYEQGELHPLGKVADASKVAIYGAGSFGRHAKQFIEKNTNLQVVAWIDKSGDGSTILRQEQLPTIACDVILVCALLSDVVQDILKDFEKMKIDMRKVRCIHAV